MSDFSTFKQEIVETAQRLVGQGYLMATGGNLSVRLPGRGGFAITPSNFDYMKMVADDICVLDSEGEQREGPHVPSVEAGMHLAVYRARPDVNAVVHTHQVFASAVALLGRSIPALFDEQARFLGRSVELIPYAPSGTGFLSFRVKRSVRSFNNAYIMKNHGALCFGHYLERAAHNVEILEKVSHAFLLALSTGQKVGKVPLAVREVAFSKLRKDQRLSQRGEISRRGE